MSDEQNRRATERAEREQRIRQRTERRRAESTRGMRRFRPGPGKVQPWQFTPASQRQQEEALDHQILALENAVHELGAIGIRALYQAVAARYWGPGSFGRALREAIREGRIVRSGVRQVGPPEEPDQESE